MKKKKEKDNNQPHDPQRLIKLIDDFKKFVNPRPEDQEFVSKSVSEILLKGKPSNKRMELYVYGKEGRLILAEAHETVLIKNIKTYADDANLGGKRRKQLKEFTKTSIENRQKEAEFLKSEWLKAAKNLRKKLPKTTIRGIAIKTCKKLELPDKSFQSIYKYLLKNKNNV